MLQARIGDLGTVETQLLDTVKSFQVLQSGVTSSGVFSFSSSVLMLAPFEMSNLTCSLSPSVAARWSDLICLADSGDLVSFFSHPTRRNINKRIRHNRFLGVIIAIVKTDSFFSIAVRAVSVQ